MQIKIKFRLFFVFYLIAYSLSADSMFDESDFLFRGVGLSLGEPVAADISFCIADLKFDGENLKICEFGEGCHSKFRGFDKLYGNGKAWELFWIYLNQFKMPIWYVGAPNNPKFKEEISYDIFKECGGEFVDSFASLQRNKNFLNVVGRGYIKNKSSISEYKAIVCVKHLSDIVKKFRSEFPNVLIWDVATFFYVSSKLKTRELFENDDDLLKYRPMSWLFKRVEDSVSYDSYVKEVAEKILSDKKCGYYVIKPINGTMGHGILIVQEEDLQKTLNFVLKK